jgi:hypothetical protein
VTFVRYLHLLAMEFFVGGQLFRRRNGDALPGKGDAFTSTPVRRAVSLPDASLARHRPPTAAWRARVCQLRVAVPRE